MNPPGRWKILVVDEHSQRLIGSVLKQFDILEENVTRTSFCFLLLEPNLNRRTVALLPLWLVHQHCIRCVPSLDRCLTP